GPGGEGQPPEEEKTDGDGTIETAQEDKVLVYTVHLTLGGTGEKAFTQLAGWASDGLHWLRGQGEMATARPRYHDLAKALKDYFEEKKAFPQGALPREQGAREVAWRPDQRLGLFAALLPYMGAEYSEWALDLNSGWNEGKNLPVARRMVPLL